MQVVKLNLDLGIMRLMKTLVVVFFIVHLFGCSWFFLAKLSNFSPDTWVVRYDLLDNPPIEQYLAAVYWYSDIFL